LRTWIITHGDGDGVTSAAIALAVFPQANVFFSHPAGLYEDLVDTVKEGDNVIICDIAVSEREVEELRLFLGRLGKRGDVVYIDHHPPPVSGDLKGLPITLVRGEGCAAELTYLFFKDKLSWDMSRVALYGAICDYETDTRFFREALKDWDQRMVFFEAGVLAQGLEGSRGEHDFKRHVVRTLSENRLPSSLSELLLKALIETMSEEEMRRNLPGMIETLAYIAFVVNPRGSIARAAGYVRAISGKTVGIAANKKKGMMVMSLRTNDDRVDLNLVLRKLAPRFGGTGGGHPNAAGARIPENVFRKFLASLDNEVGRILEVSG